MDLPQRIVVGSDGSSTAGRALAVAAALARVLVVPLVVVTAWERRAASGSGDDATWQGESTWAEQVAADGATAARAAGVDDVTATTPEGAAPDALRAVAAAAPGTLVVVGSVGLDSAGDRRLGSIPHDLAHTAPGDLLLVRPDDGPTPGWAEVVLTTDGSPTSLHAARAGLALARALRVPASLVHVARELAVARPVLETTVGELDGDPIEQVPVADDDVSAGIATAVAGRGLLVLGNRRMRGLGRLLGSVPDDLVHHLPSDLLLVNTTGRRL